MLVTFEESVEEVTADVASLGFGLDGLQRDGLLVVYAFRAEPTEVAGTGEFGFGPLFLLLDNAIKGIGARRVVLDTIEVLKQRGSAHSDQVREFVLTDHGIGLADVYVGPRGVLTSSAGLSQKARAMPGCSSGRSFSAVSGRCCGASCTGRRNWPRGKTNSPRSRPS